MRHFLLTPIKDRVAGHTYSYWMVSYPKSGPAGRNGSTGRKQRKFSSKEKAEEFLAREKKRYEARWRTEWWGDTRARNDAASALSIISKIGGGSLVAAARVYEQCRRAQEFRVADERTGGQRLELSARIRFGLEKAARRRGVSTEDLIAGVLWEFIEKESQACGEEEN
jgi:hypothetical protein